LQPASFDGQPEDTGQCHTEFSTDVKAYDIAIVEVKPGARHGSEKNGAEMECERQVDGNSQSSASGMKEKTAVQAPREARTLANSGKRLFDSETNLKLRRV
jgi:hypothetical protein